MRQFLQAHPFGIDRLVAIAVPAVTGMVLERHGYSLIEAIGIAAVIQAVLIFAIELEAARAGRD